MSRHVHDREHHDSSDLDRREIDTRYVEMEMHDRGVPLGGVDMVGMAQLVDGMP